MPSSRAIWAFDFPLVWASCTASCLNSAVKIGCGFAIMISFSQETRSHILPLYQIGGRSCGRCPVRLQCTKSRQRTLSVRRHEAHIALEAARQREQTEEFKKAYAQHAGVEGVHAKAGSSDGFAPFTLHWRASNSPSACRDCNRHACLSVA